MYRLKFGPEQLRALLEGDKRTTWRLLSDTPVSLVEPGHRFYALNKHETEMAILQVEWTKLTRVGLLTEEDKKFHKSYETEEEILDELSMFYPDTDVKSETGIVVIRFTLVEKFVEI